MSEKKYESDYMNEVLGRIGERTVHAIPGTQAGPSFYAAFMGLLDRIEAVERLLATLIRLEREGLLRPTDSSPSDETH